MTSADRHRRKHWPRIAIAAALLGGTITAVAATYRHHQGPSPSDERAAAGQGTVTARQASAARLAAVGGRAPGTDAPGPARPAGAPRAAAVRAVQPARQAAAAVGATRLAAAEQYVSGPLRAPGGPFLVDSLGRVVILHGVDAVYKYPPYELVPAPGKPWNFDAADAARIAGLGFDVVRLGMTWAGLEPGTAGPNDPAICQTGPPTDPHQWSAAVARAYLERLARTVDLLGRYHVYTLLDMHQDIYSSVFGGEGAPPWAVCTGGVPFIRPPGRWSRAYASPAVDAAFHAFWTNSAAGDLQGQFDRAWTTVATFFRSNRWVLGYDPFNEPFSRSLAAGGDDRFGAELACFYLGSAAAAAPGHPPLACPPADPSVGLLPRLLAADPTHLVFPEPDIFGRRGAGPTTLGPLDLPRVVFNVHVYCGQRNLSGNPTSLGACAAHQAAALAQRAADRAEMASAAQPGGPAWFVSELGATSDTALLQQVTAMADEHLVGWAYWAWKYYGDPTGSADEALVLPDGRYRPTVSVLSQTYAQAVAGTPLSMSFDASTGAFRLVYVPKPAVHAPTVVFVPVALHYPAGYCASVSGGTVVSKPGSSRLLVLNRPSARLVRVDLTASACPGSPR